MHAFILILLMSFPGVGGEHRMGHNFYSSLAACEADRPEAEKQAIAAGAAEVGSVCAEIKLATVS